MPGAPTTSHALSHLTFRMTLYGNAKKHPTDLQVFLGLETDTEGGTDVKEVRSVDCRPLPIPQWARSATGPAAQGAGTRSGWERRDGLAGPLVSLFPLTL